jgi:predicted MPP superfamily phosphohydrolase
LTGQTKYVKLSIYIDSLGIDYPGEDIVLSWSTLSRRAFLKLGVASALEITLLGLGSMGYAYKIEPGWVEAKSVPLALPRLALKFDGYRVVQISDIHMDGWMTQARLAEIIELVNRQRPDLVAITGDFFTYTPERFAKGMVAALGDLAPRDATVAVLGNHDHWTDPSVVRKVIGESGVINVSNAVHTLRREDAMLHVAGVDDVWENQDRLDLVLKELPDQGAAILLAHEPDFADVSAKTGRFDLQLSGHSHGGQVILPFRGPLVLPRYARKYPVGRYQVSEMIQYTNRGLGMISPRIRFNCRPEITVFTLMSET